MVWTTPPTWVAATVVTPAQLNTYVKDNLLFLRNGIVSVATINANSAATSGTTELTLATSSSITFDGLTTAEVSFSWYNTTHTVTTDVFLMRLYDGATHIGQWLVDISANGRSGNMRVVVAPTAGAHQYTARVVRSSGTGTATLIASATTPAQLLVRQVS